MTALQQATASAERDHARATAEKHRGYVRSTWPTLCPVWMGPGDHCFEASPLYTDIGHVHPAYHSAASFHGLFGLKGRGGDSSLLRSLGVRYRVAARYIRGGNEIFRSGDLRVFEIAHVAEGPYRVVGRAQVRLESFEDERIRIDVKNAGPADRLDLSIPFFPNWHAYIDEREVPLEETSVEGITKAMALSLRNGSLELRYERGTPELAGKLVTVAALLLCLILAIGRWPLPKSWRERLGVLLDRGRHRVLSRRWMPAVAAGALGSLLFLWAGVVIWERYWEERPRFDTVLDFEDARVWTLEDEERTPCRRSWTEAWRCGEARNEVVTPTYVWVDVGINKGAIWAHPIENTEVHIDFPAVKLESALDGGTGVAHSGSGRTGVRLEIKANGNQLCDLYYTKRRGWTEFHCDTSDRVGETVRLEFVVTCPRPRRRHFVFRAWTADSDSQMLPTDPVRPEDAAHPFGDAAVEAAVELE